MEACGRQMRGSNLGDETLCSLVPENEGATQTLHTL